MSEVQEVLATTFYERCMAFTNRNIGKIALSDGLLIGAMINDGTEDPFSTWLAEFNRSETVVGDDGISTTLFTSISVDKDGIFKKAVETEVVDDQPRPTLASEDVMERYLLEDLADQMVETSYERACMRLVQHLRALGEAEELGLFDVSPHEVEEAITALNTAIAVHDQAA